MKSAIVFASKHGTTTEIAHRIARELGTGHPGDLTPGHTGETTPSPSTPDTDTPADQDVTVLDLADGTRHPAPGTRHPGGTLDPDKHSPGPPAQTPTPLHGHPPTATSRRTPLHS